MGYTSVMVTNHFRQDMRYFGEKETCISAYLKDFAIAKRAGDRLGIHVIFGCEIQFAENRNDYLLFNITPEFLQEAYEYLLGDFVSFSKRFRSEGVVILQAHPFKEGMTLHDPAYLDGMETFNVQPGTDCKVALAARYARKHNLLVSAGSDYHYAGKEGVAGILTKIPLKTSSDVAEVLKSRDYLLDVGGNIILPYPEQK